MKKGAEIVFALSTPNSFPQKKKKKIVGKKKSTIFEAL